MEETRIPFPLGAVNTRATIAPLTTVYNTRKESDRKIGRASLRATYSFHSSERSLSREKHRDETRTTLWLEPSKNKKGARFPESRTTLSTIGQQSIFVASAPTCAHRTAFSARCSG